ncbi:MAG: hypothetical protein ABH952_00525 [Candidatus Omnitrophota bacterium]
MPEATNIRRIFDKLKNLADTLFIELYNKKMGNWAVVGKILSKKQPEACLALEKIFKDKETYTDFCQTHKQEIMRINKNYGFKIEFFYPGI